MTGQAPLPDYSLAPTDEQMERSPLVYFRVDIDPKKVQSNDWRLYANYETNPLPNAITDVLTTTIAALTNNVSHPKLIEIELRDRPPRASPLFPTFFVDLAAMVDYLRQVVPQEAVGALVATVLQSVGTKVWKRIGSPKLPDDTIKLEFSPSILELLCINYAMLDQPPNEPYTLQRETFNTRIDGGYTYPIDESLPMGWKITVGLPKKRYTFVVDSSANAHSLEFVEEGQSIQVDAVNLLSPDKTRSVRDHFEADSR